MTWATPLIAGIAAAIAIPTLLILYFLKLRRRDLEVSTTLLWKKSIQDLQANAPFQKLRRNLLLFLQLLALLAALAALGQPQFKALSTKGARHVIMLDRSASMNSTDGADTEGSREPRLGAAKAEALRLVDSLPEPGFFAEPESGDQAMVIVFDTSAEVVQPFTASKPDLRRAIESVTPTDSTTSLQAALKLAKAYSPRIINREEVRAVTHAPPLTIHLFSDGRIPDSARLAVNPDELEASDLSPDDQVIFHSLGSAEAPNLGITGLRAERAYDNPGKLTIFVGLHNSSLADRNADVELSIDNQRAAVRALTIPAATRGAPTAAPAAPDAPPPLGDIDPRAGGLVFTLDRPEGGVAAVRLIQSQPDSLPTDDIAYVVIPPARRLSVALVTSGNLFLREAIEGMNLSRRVVITPEAFQQMAEGKSVNNTTLADFDVVVLDRFIPTLKDAAGKAIPTLPPGRILVMSAVPPPPLGAIDEGPGEPSLIVDYARDHPALRYAGLTDLLIARGRKVKIAPESPVRAIASDQYGPAILEAANNATRAIIVPFDPAETDWPLKPGFVLFLASAIQNLATDGPEALGDSLRPGETLVQRLPLGATDARIVLPDTTSVPLAVAPDGRVAFGPVSKVGIYTVSWAGPTLPTDVVVDNRGRRAAAVNLLDPAESLVAARSTLDLPGRLVTATPTAESDSVQRLWPWLLLAALAVVMFEWFIYNRKVYV
ncbi:MAG: VWA domain-containing protein [Phycisphaeraceae bacterium]|nr:VWA domain-containing protein [Phycisphaeraceae bacterium]